MRFLTVAVLVSIAAAQAQAQNAISVKPSFIGVNFGNNPLLSAKAGVSFGQNNVDNTTQNSAVDFYGVQQVAIGKAGSNLSNTATVNQQGASTYAGVGQAIRSLPPMPSLGGP
jgi:hypothetical protein